MTAAISPGHRVDVVDREQGKRWPAYVRSISDISGMATVRLDSGEVVIVPVANLGLPRRSAD